MHGHLRPTNILFTAQGEVKLTDFELQDDTSDVDNAHFYLGEGETASIAADLYAAGIVLYQLFTGSLPRRDGETSFVIRKQFSKLPEDIQNLITNMISTIPEKRHTDSLLRAVATFDQHMTGNHIKTFTEKPPRDKKHQRNSRSSTPLSNILTAAGGVVKQQGRMNWLFAVLVVVFVQYLFLFDGQEKINQSMPTVYSKVVNQLEGLLGKVDVRGTGPGENSRIY